MGKTENYAQNTGAISSCICEGGKRGCRKDSAVGLRRAEWSLDQATCWVASFWLLDQVLSAS